MTLLLTWAVRLVTDVATEMYSGVQRIPSSVSVISVPDMFRIASTAQAPLRRTALNVMARLGKSRYYRRPVRRSNLRQRRGTPDTTNVVHSFPELEFGSLQLML